MISQMESHMSKSHQDFHPFHIGDEQLRLLERLSNACAVSGDEGEVRKIVLEEIRPFADEVKVDPLGNVLVTRHSKNEKALRVMLAAHMDEVGLMITNDEGDGLFRFEVVGGLDAWKLAGKAVWVGKEHLPGVIGLKPIHLAEREELQRPVTLDGLRIDLGPGAKAKVGDRAVFSTSFTHLGPSLRGKALDDRVGVATLIELVKQAPADITLQAAFTVQEENGLRGAKVAAYAFDPHLAIALDCTPAYDLPVWDGSENTRYNTRLGDGPVIYVADAATLSHPGLVSHFLETAEKFSIPCQVRQPGGGGTDAGAIHKQRAGIPTVSISVPGRYLHSTASLVRVSDWENSLSLIYAALTHLSLDILQFKELL
jgi:tetrahedral aminopeptidase